MMPLFFAPLIRRSVLALASALLLSATAFATDPIPGVDVRLEMEGSKPVTTQTDADGKFEFPNLKPGDYSIYFSCPNTDAFRGVTNNTGLECAYEFGVHTAREAGSGMATGKTTAPRDVATGQSSGKRQYQPVIIRKRIDKASPLLCKVVDDGSTISGSITTRLLPTLNK